MPEDQAAAYLLGHAGESVDPTRLIEALASDRPRVTQAACDLLIETLDQWQLEPARHTSPHVAELAEQLARRAEDWCPEAQQTAAQVAIRLLRWPVDERVVDAQRLVANCEAVLRYRAYGDPRQEARPRGRPVAAQSPPGSPPGPPASEPSVTAWRDAVPAPSERQFELPGGNLPVELSTMPEPQPPAPTSGPTPQSEPPPASRPLPPEGSEHTDSLAEADPNNATSVPGRLGRIAARRIRRAPVLNGFGSPAKALTQGQRNLYAPLQGLNDKEVMQTLHAQDETLQSAAEQELRRRGYKTIHVELSRRLTDPSPDVRRQLAERLPGIPGIDALPWLRDLARDPDANVRVTALTILATSSDPVIKKWVREAVRRETDDRVTRRLEQVLMGG
jgi:hypothetical protein